VIRVTSVNQKPDTSEAKYPPSPSRVFDRMFVQLLNEWAAQYPRATATGEDWRPPVDVYEKEGNLVIQTYIPGVEEKDIDLKLEGNVLTVKGERKADEAAKSGNYYQVEGSYGPFTRSFSLPESVDLEKISAAYKSGVLALTIPSKPEVKARTIKINA